MSINKKKIAKCGRGVVAALGCVYVGRLAVAGKKKRRLVYDKYFKRAIDITLSFAALIIFSPVFAVVALAIYLDDPGPVLFAQKRVGQNKKPFTLHKFRSMKISTPRDTPTHLLDTPEQYITKTGRFLRKYSLDELPQIWDILLGNMSLIGPRPALWNQKDLIEERDKYGANDVRPGLTGWAQINGRDKLVIDIKAKYDGEYVQKESIGFDIKCLLGTILRVINHDGVVEGGIRELGKEDISSEDRENSVHKRILVICQYYYPEPFRVKDICEEMVRRGYEVQVVTGYPNYPEGILYKGYEKRKRIDEYINGVRVHRCYTIPRKTGVLYRVLNYYSYVLSSLTYILSPKCIASDGKPFDAVYCNQLSPVMMAEAAILYKKKYKVPVVLYCLDLWPESLIAGGITRKSKVYRYYHYVSKRIYKSMDRILITSRLFSKYFRDEFGILEDKIVYLPQYAEDIFVDIDRKEENGTFDFLFAGNIGKVQSVETILEAARLLEGEPVKFHIVGGGAHLERLQKIGKNMKNVEFYGRRPLEDMPEFYGKADAMLVTLQADPILSLTLPGKVQSYMAAGKPVIGAADGETKAVIDAAQCGYCGKASNSKELASNIRRFITEADRKVMGKNARIFYEEHFMEDMFMNTLERELSQ